MFYKALSALGLKCREVLHVGDSYSSDVAGVHAAGIPVLWVNRKDVPLPDNFSTPEYTSVSLRGLLDLL
jgi:2-haloacid dehalogenase/putative hydrolase of the HAD superfamily